MRSISLGAGKLRIYFLITALAFGGFLLVTPQAMALHFNLGEEAALDLDTTLIYGVSMRMKDANEELLTNINADDGNRSFEKYDLISNRFTVRGDLDFQFKNVGLFSRGRAFYDFVYEDSNSNDSPETHNSGPIMGGPLTDHQEFTDAAKDQMGSDAELLDYFIYGDFNPAGHPFSIRIGSQVVSWGESLFTLGGISTAQGHADATMLNIPGMELKDIFLPSEQVSAKLGLGFNLSFEGYYQWEWEKHRSDPAGTYFSTMDFGDVGGYNQIAVPGVPVTADRIEDERAKDDGQWGIALRYLSEKLNDTEFGLYYLNHHEKFPMAQTHPGAGTPTIPDWEDPLLNFVDNLGYNLAYQEDIALYGFSLSSQVGETNISSEVSYREDYLIPVNDSNPYNLLGYTYEPFDIVQVLASAIHFFGPMGFVDQTTLMFETGFNQVLDAENLYKDQFAWGSMTSLSFTFLDIAPFLDMKIPVSFKHRPNGVSSLPGTFTEKQHSVGIGADFTYRQNITFGFKYTDFLGDPDDSPQMDRDYLSFQVKYTF